MTTTEAANNHYQELENFRKELANSGRTPTEEELQLRSNKILALMKECHALQTDPTVVDKSAIPQITSRHIEELEQWNLVNSLLHSKEGSTNRRLIAVRGFSYNNEKEKSMASPPIFDMTRDTIGLNWPAFKEQIVNYLKLCNFRQKTAVIMVNLSLEARTRAMVAHITLDNYIDMPDGNGLWMLLEEYTKIFMAGSKTGIPLMKFQGTQQRRMDLSTFHATLRQYYREAYPELTAQQLNQSSELCQKFIDGLVSLKVREHVIRDRGRTWHTYEELLTAAQHEQATQVNVHLTTASSQASLQAGLSPAQIIREQEGVFIPATQNPRLAARQQQASQQLPPPEPMEIGALTGEKCKYCPEKDKPGYKGHTVENCWKVEKAMRHYESLQNRPPAPRFTPRRTNFTPRSGYPSQRYSYQGPSYSTQRYPQYRAPFRGNQRTYGAPRARPFRRQVTAAIMDDLEQGFDPEEALNYHLASLGIQEEEEEENPEEEGQEQTQATGGAYINDHTPEEFTED